MTGPEHYQEAERLLDELTTFQAGLDSEVESDEYEEAINLLTVNTARAQVHATLALAAATGLNDAEGGFMVEDFNAWQQVAGTRPDGVS